MFADPAKPEGQFLDLELSPVTGDHNYIRGNNKFFAVSAKGGGGPVLVLPYTAAGKLPRGYPLINGHSGAVLDTAWCPFNDHLLATGSDDATVREGSCSCPSPAAPWPPRPSPAPPPPLTHPAPPTPPPLAGLFLRRRSSCGPSPRAG